MSLIRSKTNSRYISPDHGKMIVSFPDHNSFRSGYAKQRSYYVRNYYHYKYIKSINGEAFFVTLTYNEKNLPRWFGHACCDNRDLRWLLNSSGFRQCLRDKYGVKLGYFITTEYGEGKGVRGKGNNPHYHAVFYLWTDDHSPVFSHISPTRFKVLLKKYWQGVGRRSAKDYVKGKVDFGKEGGVINSAAAISYVSKYCVKDQTVLHNTLSIRDEIYSFLIRRLVDKPYFESKYFTSSNIDAELSLILSHITFYPEFKVYIDRAFRLFYRHLWRNVYSPKVFQSQGIGLYGLNFVDIENCTIQVPDEDKVVKQDPLPLYLYRKVYMDTVKTADGQNKYVLNELGIQHRLDSLNDKIQFVADESRNILAAYSSDRIDANFPPFISCVLKSISKLDCFNLDFFERYAVYTLVYKDRICRNLGSSLNFFDDYCEFLQPDFYEVQQDDYSYASLCKLPRYSMHPYFRDYVSYFDALDELLMFHEDVTDSFRKREYQKQRDNKRQLTLMQYCK